MAFLLVAPLLLPAQTPSRQEAKVRKQLDRGRPYPAIRNATAMLLKGGHPEFYALRAEGYNSIGEHAKAESDARESLRLLPQPGDGLYQLAVAEQGMGQWDSAAHHLQQVTGPRRDVLMRLALVEQMRGRSAEALGAIDRALAEAPQGGTDAARLHRIKGEIAATAGDSATARRELDLAVQMAPADPVGYNSRGYYVHAWQGHHRAAVQDYDRAIKLNPNYSYAFNNRGWSLYKMGQTAKGIKDIERAKRKKAYNPYVYRNLGFIALEGGDTAKACIQFRQALDKGFTAQFGDEVELQVAAHCGKAPVVPPPASNAPDRKPGQPVEPRSNAPE